MKGFRRNIDPNANEIQRRYGWRWSWWIILLLMAGPTIGMMQSRSQQIFWEATITPNGLQLQANEQPVEITFGMSVDEVRGLLGQESVFADGIMIYAPLGLNLAMDETGVQLIAYFTSNAPSARWQVGSVSLEAGFFGQSFNRAIKNLGKEGALLASDTASASFSIMGNILRIDSDTRSRLALIAYRQQDFVDNQNSPSPTLATLQA